jgi:2-enoate reductase
MNNQYSSIFKPFQIGKCEIPNRMIMSPMLISDCFTSEGELTEDGIDFYEERARGGFGLIYTGAFAALSSADLHTGGLIAPLKNPGAFLKGALQMTDRCHMFGTKVFGEVTFGHGRNRGEKTPSPSAMLGNPSVMSEAYTAEDIKAKVQAVIQTAVLLKKAGFDGIDVHGMHWGYVLEQFIWNETNQREDMYGGSLENRLRPCREIIEGIKEQCGKNYPVTIRIDMESYLAGLNRPTMDTAQEKGISLDQAKKIAKVLESFGYDAIMVDAGVYESMFYAEPPMYIQKGYTIPKAKEIRKEISIPLIVTGSRIDEADMILDVINSGTADAVGVGRAALADPMLPIKIETGHPELIRPCIGCNACVNNMFRGGKLECAVNPCVGRETRTELHPAAEKKNVIVVGGGAAGMEAARVLKLQGHNVKLYEKKDTLGGNLIPAGKHSFKRDVYRLDCWYQNEMERLGIQIVLNHEVSAEELDAETTDAVVLAVGSSPRMIPLKGNGTDKVKDCLSAILYEDELKKNAVIVGGGQIGCEMALSIKKSGRNATVVEALPEILSSGAAVPAMNKTALKMLMQENGIRTLTSTRLDRVDETGVIVLNAQGEEEHIDADDVVISVGMRSNPSLLKELRAKGIVAYEIGDGSKVGDIHSAIRSAFEIAREI